MCNPSNDGGLKKMLDLSKPVMTKDGRKVRILCTDAKGDYPVVGVIIGELKDTANTWTSDGSFHIDGRFHENDLIKIPEPAEEIEGWINISETFICKEQADLYNGKDKRIACIKIKFKKGEGLER